MPATLIAHATSAQHTQAAKHASRAGRAISGLLTLSLALALAGSAGATPAVFPQQIPPTNAPTAGTVPLAPGVTVAPATPPATAPAATPPSASTADLKAAPAAGALSPWQAGTPQRVASVEGIDEYRFPNGLRVLLAPDAGKPTITVNMVYLVGSRHENYGETGMAHLLEHMLFKGTPALPNGALVRELKARGMHFNGTTSFDRTNYYETFTASDDNLDWALRMEADRMINSYVARKDLDSEMTVVRNEMEAGENNPARVLAQQVLSAAYQWHNYGKSTIGARSDVELVNIAHLQDFYRKYYQPDNAVLVVAGQFESGPTLEKIARHFGRIAKPLRKLEATWTRDPVQDGERQVTLNRRGDYQLLNIVYHLPNGAHRDTVAMNVLASILADNPSGRLYKALVASKLAASVSAGVDDLAEPGYLEITATVDKNGKLDAARQAIFDTLETVRREPVSEAELQRAQRSYANSFDQLLTNPQGLAIALTDSIAQGDWRLLFWQRDEIAKVTAADLQRVASNYLQASNRTVGQFIPAEATERAQMPADAQPADVLRNYAGRAGLNAGESFLPTPANIEARTTRSVLPNGARLALLSKKTRGSTVNGRFTFGFGDAASLHGKQTAASFAASLLTRGSAKYNREQIADRLRELQANLGISLAENQLVVSFDSRRQHLPALLDLIAELLRHPAFPADELEQLRSQSLTGVESGRSEPQDIARRLLAQHDNPYPTGDWRHANSIDDDLANLRRLKRNEVVDFHRDFLGAQNANLALVGDFDGAAASAQLAQIFGDWRAARPYTRIDHPAHATTPLAQTVQTPDKANAIYFGRLSLPLNDQSPAAPALRLADRILGGGGLKSRLGDRLRQKDGISYGAGSSLALNPWEENSTLSFYAIYAPQNLARLQQGVREELARLLKDGVTAAEVAEARQGLLQERTLNRSNDGTLATILGAYLELGRTLQWDADYEAKLRAATVSDINAALRQYLKPEALAQIYAGDFNKAGNAAGKNAP